MRGDWDGIFVGVGVEVGFCKSVQEVKFLILVLNSGVLWVRMRIEVSLVVELFEIKLTFCSGGGVSEAKTRLFKSWSGLLVKNQDQTTLSFFDQSSTFSKSWRHFWSRSHFLKIRPPLSLQGTLFIYQDQGNTLWSQIILNFLISRAFTFISNIKVPLLFFRHLSFLPISSSF